MLAVSSSDEGSDDSAATATASGSQRKRLCTRCDKCGTSTCPRASRPRSQYPSFKLARIPDSEVVDLSGYAAEDAGRPYDVYQGGGKAILCLATKAAVLKAIGLRVKAVPGDGFCGYLRWRILAWR